MVKTIIALAAISGLLAVGLGAFGAHGLKDRLSTDMLAVYQTAVQYHFYHTLALLLVGGIMLHAPQINLLRWSAVLFALGILVFSGSLYTLAITGIRWLGAITPVGGLLFMAGWACLVTAAYRINA